MAEPSLREILDFAAEAAWQAGRITLQYFQTGVAVEEKADASPVTVADKGAEDKLREMIEAKFPEDGILGEEHGEKQGSTGRRWIVDPIDGTKSFIHGVPFYGVLVGVEIDDVPTVGVVNFPALNEMLCAAKGLGCTWNGRRARVSDVSDLKDATVLFTDPDNWYGKDEPAKRIRDQAKLVRGWSDCYGYALVATGRAEVMLDPKMNVWDCAALAPIMEETGGTFTDWKGKATIWAEEAVGTNGVLFERVMEVIR
ncbi:MAG: histidinol-phosphatase [bacterium]|nr:histidinol-phosphatase [bacterium]